MTVQKSTLSLLGVSYDIFLKMKGKLKVFKCKKVNTAITLDDYEFLNDKGKVINLVVVESDITNIKKAEALAL